MKPFRFMAQCQDWSITKQYDNGVRCFDLRVRPKKIGGFNSVEVVHGYIVYDIDYWELREQLAWLDKKGDVYIRLILDVRNKAQYNERNIELFKF